jgi:hypothetical protein
MFACEQLGALPGKVVVVRPGACDPSVVVLGARPGPGQDEQVEGRERVLVEAQRPADVGQDISQVGARPVRDGHEVVTGKVDAVGAEIAQALLVRGDPAIAARAPGLDVLMHGHAFDDRPAQLGCLDQLPALRDGLHGPRLPVGYLVQGGHDPGYTG